MLTWDGLEIAGDRPTGATVVVRRPTAAGGREMLLLHRRVNGPDFEGDWAWTSPAGCRQPGEAVYPAALRELAEEAGLVDLAPWAVDLSGEWATFGVDVPAGTAVELVDPEHDRYRWLDPADAARRILPRPVAEQQVKAATSPRGSLRFRPMADSDCAVVASWHRAPHVREWWDSDSLDEEAVRARYSPSLDGAEPTRMWVLDVDGAAAGMLQDYRVGDDAGYAEATGNLDAIGFDYLIGDPALVDRGLGTRMIWEFCRDVLRPGYPEAEHFLASPSHRNARSLRVLAKCGFTAGVLIDGPAVDGRPGDSEVVCTLDVAHWFGSRR